jgi:hypothetical protein
MQWPALLEKADVRPIVREHFATLSNFRTGALSLADVLFFFGLPFAAGVVLDLFHFGFRVDAVNGFLNAFAILTGLMLNLLVLVFTISATMAEKADFQMRRRILREVFSNVCFCILVAVGVSLTALISLSYMRSIPFAQTGYIATFMLSFLTLNFVFSLLMIVKRMYLLITTEFKGLSSQRAA